MHWQSQSCFRIDATTRTHARATWEAYFTADDTVNDDRKVLLNFIHFVMTTTGVQRRLLAVFLVLCLVTLANAVLKDEQAPLASLSIRVCSHALFVVFSLLTCLWLLKCFMDL